MARFLGFCFALIAWGLLGAAHAQAFFANPFLPAADILAARLDTSPATLQLRYAVTASEHGLQETTGELVIDIAPDWAKVRKDNIIWLYDFRLNRTFEIQTDSQRFISYNSFADPIFRIAERQNRDGLLRMLGTLGQQAQIFDACDVDSELGLVIPGSAPGNTNWRTRSGVSTLQCAGRDIGSFESSGTAAPPAFWPVMMLRMTTHPALYSRVRASGQVPRTLSSSFRVTDAATNRSWRLISADAVTTAYPLVSALTNGTAAAMDEISPGAGALATEAIQARAAGGPPTLESWDRYLADLTNRQGPAAAAMLVMPTYNMFPELDTACANGSAHAACAAMRNLAPGALSEDAPRAVLDVALAEQNGSLDSAITAMQRTQSSPYRDHAVLGAAFALALQRFNQNQLAQARAAHLPSDAAALQSRALQAFPYNPAYWTDVGDRFGANYQWREALMFYDVAFSLPMPSAIRLGPAPVSKRATFERIWSNFPDFFLPR